MILVALAAVALAAPDKLYGSTGSDEKNAKILQHDFVIEDDGRYNLDMKTSNGISVSEHGSPDGPKGAIISSGVFS